MIQKKRVVAVGNDVAIAAVADSRFVDKFVATLDDPPPECDIVVAVAGGVGHEDVDACLELLLDIPDADSVLGVERVWEHQSPKTKRVGKGGFLAEVAKWRPGKSRRDSAPANYVSNDFIHVCWRSTLVKHGSMVGARCVPYVVPSESTGTGWRGALSSIAGLIFW